MNRSPLALLFLSPLVLAASSAVAPSVDPNASCKICHEDVAKARTHSKGPHSDTDCIDCHQGFKFNPHVSPELSETTKEAAKALEPYAKHAPEALTSCGDCHDDEVEAWRESVHGSKTSTEAGHDTPSCASCHGEIHDLPATTPTKLAMSERCISCHGFAEEGRDPLSPHVVDTYRDTIHGKMLRLGNEEAASCVDCHGSHAIHATDDSRSSMHADHRGETCAKCHQGVSASFTSAISHRPHKIDLDFWSGITSIGFSILTASVIFLLFLHVVLDFLRTGQIALARKRSPAHVVKDGPIGAEDQVQRFDIHMRLQHGMMMVSFTSLVLTGWPLKAASVGHSSRIAELLGGQATLAILHRIAGALLIATALYHLAYLVAMYRRGKLTWAMVPGFTDMKHVWENLLFFLGRRAERPKFGRWTYYEKFDYWAVFWGMVVMGGSGLMLWFPEASATLVPGSALSLALIAHSDEALLALLAIFLWHFYNVHFRPTVFPMSYVFLTGKLSAEALWTEHRAEYEAIYGKEPPRTDGETPAWHRRNRWSYVAVTVILLAGLLVVAGNVSNVRDEILALGDHGRTAALAAARTAVQPALASTAEQKPIGVFDPGFKANERCFGCHNEQRYLEGEKGKFPHKYHFEEEELDRDCNQCHVASWHESLELKTDQCMECHEPEEIGIAKAN